MWVDPAIEKELQFIRTKPEVMFKIKSISEQKRDLDSPLLQRIAGDETLIMSVSVAGIRVKSGSLKTVILDQVFRDGTKVEIDRGNVVKFRLKLGSNGVDVVMEVATPVQRDLAVLCLRHFSALSGVKS